MDAPEAGGPVEIAQRSPRSNQGHASSTMEPWTEEALDLRFRIRWHQHPEEVASSGTCSSKRPRILNCSKDLAVTDPDQFGIRNTP